jgi:adenylate kinase
MKKMLIMGPPGAGKGTQAEKIIEFFNIPHISTGDMFRAAIHDKTEIGLLAKTYIDAGNLVPDEVTVGIVKERLAKDDCKNGFLLDGFPRDIHQAEMFKEMLKELGISIDLVLNIDVDHEKLVNRIIGRRICPDCGRTYHIKYNKPLKEGVCDECGANLIQRKDDNVETVKNRLEVYNHLTEPVINFYKDLVVNIDGDRDVDVIFEDIKKVIGE